MDLAYLCGKHPKFQAVAVAAVAAAVAAVAVAAVAEVVEDKIQKREQIDPKLQFEVVTVGNLNLLVEKLNPQTTTSTLLFNQRLFTLLLWNQLQFFFIFRNISRFFFVLLFFWFLGRKANLACEH